MGLIDDLRHAVSGALAQHAEEWRKAENDRRKEAIAHNAAIVAKLDQVIQAQDSISLGQFLEKTIEAGVPYTLRNNGSQAMIVVAKDGSDLTNVTIAHDGITSTYAAGTTATKIIPFALPNSEATFNAASTATSVVIILLPYRLALLYALA